MKDHDSAGDCVKGNYNKMEERKVKSKPATLNTGISANSALSNPLQSSRPIANGGQQLVTTTSEKIIVSSTPPPCPTTSIPQNATGLSVKHSSINAGILTSPQLTDLGQGQSPLRAKSVIATTCGRISQSPTTPVRPRLLPASSPTVVRQHPIVLQPFTMVPRVRSTILQPFAATAVRGQLTTPPPPTALQAGTTMVPPGQNVVDLKHTSRPVQPRASRVGVGVGVGATAVAMGECKRDVANVVGCATAMKTPSPSPQRDAIPLGLRDRLTRSHAAGQLQRTAYPRQQVQLKANINKTAAHVKPGQSLLINNIRPGQSLLLNSLPRAPIAGYHGNRGVYSPTGRNHSPCNNKGTLGVRPIEGNSGFRYEPSRSDVPRETANVRQAIRRLGGMRGAVVKDLLARCGHVSHSVDAYAKYALTARGDKPLTRRGGVVVRRGLNQPIACVRVVQEKYAANVVVVKLPPYLASKTPAGEKC